MPSSSWRMWPRWATGTPTLPTSPRALGSSGSYPVWVGRSKAIDSPVWPLARFVRYSSFDAAAVECPEYVRMSHGGSGIGGLSPEAGRRRQRVGQPGQVLSAGDG